MIQRVQNTKSNTILSVQFAVVGGGAALVAAGALAATNFAAAGTVVGGGAAVAAAGGGTMVAQSQCLGNSLFTTRHKFCINYVPGPLYCTAASGQCCEFILVRSRGRFRCPNSC